MGPCFPAQLKNFELTRDETVAIWRIARDNYIDKGVNDIRQTINGVAADLGLKPAWVGKALTKPKAIKSISNDLYAKMSDRRYAVTQAKDYVRAADEPAWKQTIKAIYKVPFSLAIYGHGTVGGITHAGALMFRPSAWSAYWPNFLKQASFLVSKAKHEVAMQELISRPNFIEAKRAGLANDPDRTYTDYGTYAKYLGSKRGRMAFDALKTLRQEMFDQQWDSTPDSIKSDPAARKEWARGLAETVNHSTGALGATEHGWLSTASKAASPLAFAAKLEASRWARIIGDPVKTAETFIGWSKASAAQRQLALTRVKHASEFAAVYFSSLLANQALLSATGSKDKINLFHYGEPDWLKHKIAGHTVLTDGGLLSPIRLLGRVIYDSVQRPQKELRGDTRSGKLKADISDYAEGKLSPAIALGKELLTGETFNHRLLPWSRDTSKKPRMTWAEFATSHAPIPLAGATREVYDSLRERGMNHIDATSLLRGLAAFGAELTGARVQSIKEPEPKASNGNSVNQKVK